MQRKAFSRPILAGWRPRLLAGALWFACSPAAHGGEWTGTLSLTSDYGDRGLSLSDHEPAVLGDVHYAGDQGWFAGVGAASVKFGSDQGWSPELIGDAGRSWTIGDDWGARASLAHYAYPSDHPHRQYDYDEASLRLGWRGRVDLGFAWSPDRAVETTRGAVSRRPSFAYELGFIQPLVAPLAAHLGAGWREQPKLDDSSYFYWSAGLGGRLGRFELDLSYIGTDGRARYLFADHAAVNRLVGTLSWRF